MSTKRSFVTAVLLLLLGLAGCRSAHVTSAILYIDQQMYDKAIAVLHEGLEYSPDEAEAYFYLGEAHSKKAEEAIRDNDFQAARKNYETAYDYYQKARKMDPKLDERVQESLLYSYVQQSNNAKTEYQGKYYEAAEGYFRLAYAALPDSIAPIKNLARMKIQLARESGENKELYAEALDLIDDVLKKNPDAYELLSNKADVLSRIGRQDEAAAIYDELLRDHPNDTALLIDIANLAKAQHQNERAADLLVRVMKLYETDDDVTNDDQVYYLAKEAAALYASKDVMRYKDALDLYEKALRLEANPEETTLLQKLQLHYNYGKYLKDQAAATDDQAKKAELLQQSQEQFQKGVDTGNALIQTYFESANGFYYLALCYQELGNEQKFTENMDNWRKFSGNQ